MNISLPLMLNFLVYDVVVMLADMDECAHSGMCPNGECFNIDGSYKCRCNEGYKQSPNQQICVGK